MSPLATRRPLDSPQAESAQHPDAKPPSPTFVRHSPEVRRDILYQVIDSPVASDVARPDSEPPRKRRRSSGEPSFLLQHPATFGPTLSGPGVAGSIPFSVSGPLISRDIVDHAAHLDSGGFGGQVAPTATVPREAVAVHDYDSGGTNEAQEAKKAKGKARDRKRRGSVLKDDGKKKRRESPREDTKTEHSARDEDVTEWLLEQYTTTSLSVDKSMEGTSAVASRSYLDASRRTDVGGRQSSEDAKSSRAKSKSAHGRTRTPTPLEEELELDGKVAVYDAATGEQPDDSDINMELDLAASSATNTKHDDPMDMDVEDELLSLVDDKPRTSQSSRSKSAATARSQDVAQRSKQLQPIWGVSEMYSGSGVPAAFSESQRESMPPPASPVKEHPQTATQSGSRASSVGVSTTQKKKDGAQKTKTKAPPKPKAKTAAKPKTKAPKEAGSPAPGGTLTPSVSATSVKSKKASPLVGSTPSGKRAGSAAAGASRSRSTSVLPGGSVGPEVDGKAEEGHAEGEEKDEQDDKLYCVCKTRYDEDRVMIACDRCDEWYHTQCVNMPDLEVDLVDQFICPPCVESNPHLHLKTTYKRRCLNGLEHPNPASPAACHKPARGAFSKYCSDECGMHYMQSRIDAWSGNKELLWESVKDAKKREGVVVRVKSNVDAVPKLEGDGHVPAERPPLDVSLEVVKPSQSKVDREVARLNAQLHGVARYRDELKKELEVVLWREKVIKLAAIRADNIDECGWDQRLCFGDEEYIEFGASVLESYEETDSGGRPDSDAVTTDGAQPEDGEWWCKGKKKCDRHAGWQKLRIVEVEFDKETKETALAKLTTQERDIRRQIEDVLDPSARARSAAMKSSGPPLQPLNGEATSNGLPKTKVNGDASKKGKKKSR
ncbi:hypothetical protein WOLCODRAFT_135204 [Wolfiporia cocos MD-104 SS10]|uniref:PHD-type domain-containing protein n=1 Tax=Wolfiporia cocos (strain MD-104) TaxID=742152 RepID=A0A2H3IUC5_WOLCO|nr:hypothetical protein WOLCODRAFT_135204 [Wolfiporia cocos MD-104 SS10]